MLCVRENAETVNVFLDNLQASKGKWVKDLKAPDIFRLRHEPGFTHE
jgi:hypothetical protein